ncbi:OmpA family protein [Flavobacterium agricola]|uniref:OmpA family protein n=1 Tax=Flavobacterium agricola TaxID=2870839 RepID=A0ABY6LYT3_9FLAO|nr:OmpA family protein [Flavobacterium agricola]UYW01157.1 OmpA family protein [Flavobacterium agricola]
MIKKVSAALLVAALSTSCVSKKLYTELEDQLTEAKQQNRSLSDELDHLTTEKNSLDLENKNLKSELDRLKAERDKLASDYAAAATKLKNLEDAYAKLEKNADETIKNNLTKNRELLAQLDAKEKALAAEKTRLDSLSNELKTRSQRVNELEQLIAAQDSKMNLLKETLSSALNAFEGKGLTVEQKNGKVYVSLENKLLFKTGSWSVNDEGRKAIVELGKVLGNNPDIAVLIEGHTDNDIIRGSLGGMINNNWDLSTKRALSVVEILNENPKIVKKNLTAAGRSEFAPVDSNATDIGKARNRRIEVILTPNLDSITKVLNEI